MAEIKVSVGVDIGGTNTVFGLVDRNGEILADDAISTAHYEDIEVFIAALYEKIISTANKLGDDVKIIGFGVGAPMGNINKGTIEHSASLPFKGIIPFSEIFSRHTLLPVIITNDANAAAVGEMIYGGAKGMKNFVVITLGTGLGGGFVVDGKLVYGNDGFAGELGHLTVVLGGRECGCGKKGCLEAYVSASGLKRTFLKMMADSLQPSELRKCSFENLDAKMIHDAAINGDYLAKEAFLNTGRMLGLKLADVVAHTNPEAIFLFAGLALAGDLIFEPAKEYMEENLLSVYKGKVKLLVSELNVQNAAVLGASALVWSSLEYI